MLCGSGGDGDGDGDGDGVCVAGGGMEEGRRVLQLGCCPHAILLHAEVVGAACQAKPASAPGCVRELVCERDHPTH